MIVCPNCDHPNPDGATQCEACYAPLPTLAFCPNCGASVQADATFCGQCGHNILPEEFESAEIASEITLGQPLNGGGYGESATTPPIPVTVQSLPPPTPAFSPQTSVDPEVPTMPKIFEPDTALDQEAPPLSATRIQVQKAFLLHLQTDVPLEISPGLTVVHIGKPNERIPPDIDVSGFPDSDIVSRVHADIRVEGDLYYLEDTGSSNGTYVNHTPLMPGNRHRLRSGDRIALGKGDKVTFIFQLS